MGIMTIDGQRVEFTDEPNVLSVIRKAGIDIPTLCYHSELSIYGACRLCTVENERGKTFASCSEKPRDGMVIYTNTPRLMHYRKLILELLLAAHAETVQPVSKAGNVTFRNWHIDSVYTKCALKMSGKCSRSIPVLRPS